MHYYMDVDNGICKIIDSYLITNPKEQTAIITDILMPHAIFQRRSVKSYLREWRAHTWLYKHNMFIDHTRDVDLDAYEKWYRRIAYFFIALLPQ